jgi:Xaa-Pro aminopeptidase
LAIAELIKKQQADYLLITAPDSVCWLLNIRGQDVPCTPLVLSYGLMDRKGNISVFLESATADQHVCLEQGEGVEFYSINTLEKKINELNYNKILIDQSNAPYWFHQYFNASKLEHFTDPCQLPKACKNRQEIEGSQRAHIRDGVALVRGLCWIEEKVLSKQVIDEVDVSQAILQFRSEQKNFQQPSFATIAGFTDHGAIVHYQPKKGTAHNIVKREGAILLLDSGGQYIDGTTDITRTIAIGAPSKEQKTMNTLVLKGHIALATAVFPKGTTGSQLDVLARYALWQNGADYDHGTGHGVGSFLGVHEGPQRISKFPSQISLQPGMIISNEPGFYKTGEYGIRIENLIVVIEHSKKPGYLAFETLSCAPIDSALIDWDLLVETEKKWLSLYHQFVWDNLSVSLPEKECEWLLSKVKPYDVQMR